MRSFFIQIFLSFWISSIAIFIAATVIFPRKDFAFPENLTAALDAALDEMAPLQFEHLKSAGCAGEKRGSVLILDASGRNFCGDTVSQGAAALAARAHASGKRQWAKIGSDWAVAKPVTDPSGNQFTVLLVTRFHPAPWWPRLPNAAIPVSALVTFIFSYLLTKPVRALRDAFRRFSAGDMSVRLRVSRSPLRDWGGADIRTLMVDFNEMADRIQALIEAHKTLVRDVSHELRSPLARLNVALELAREEIGEPIAALDRVELESSRLNTLIGELLSLSLMESIQQVPQSRVLSMGDLVEDLLPDLIFEADARGCQVVHVQKGPTSVLGNAELLRRALENVIRNAIRYTPAGKTIEIQSYEEQTIEKSTVVTRIYDNGPGVPEESLTAIFRPFYRLDAARRPTTGGFGVGLAIAERAVQLHRGTIQARNQSSGGLCVELRLPSVRELNGNAPVSV